MDKASQSYITPQYVKQGDYNGRELIVQITDGGAVKDMTGVSLELGWKHESIQNAGLEPFSELDVTQGLFKVAYPTELLNPGRVLCAIRVSENGTVTNSMNFTVTVEANPFDDTTLVSDNAFTLLEQLIKDSDATKIYEVDDRLTSQINETDTRLTSQLAEKAPQTELDDALTQLTALEEKTVGYGTKSERPATPETASLFFLTDKKRRIEFNGQSWQYLDGAPVDVLEVQDANIYPASAQFVQQTLVANAETAYENSPDMTKDLIFYTKLKLADNDDFFNLIFNIGSTQQFYISFGYNWSTSVKDGSTISIRDYINSTNTVLGSTNLYSASHEIVVWYDHKWGYLNVYVDKVLIGSWKPTAGGANVVGVNRIYGKAGSTTTLVTLDYWYMASPLIVAIGDSITAGAVLHAPNPDHYAGIDNYSSNYPKMISDHLQTNGIRNYFLVNKGVNGETTDQMKSRFTADVINKGCKYVMIHGGINDHGTHGNPATTVQNKLDMASSAQAADIEVLMIGVIPTKTSAPLSSHQFSINLHEIEQVAYSSQAYADLWDAIEGVITNVADDAKMADTVHPNIAGYTAISEEIKKLISNG
nr:GDSL-type esterase/lipase family protein [Exiguobacterium sp. s124]